MGNILTQVRDHPIRGIKTLLLVFLCFYGGITLTLVGPTLVSLQLRSNSSVTQASYGLSFRSAGASVGAVAGE